MQESPRPCSLLRTPGPKSGELTVAGLVNHFLDAKEKRLKSGELQRSTFSEYFGLCGILVSEFGKTRTAIDLGPEDFERLRSRFAERAGLTRLGKLIQITKCIFKYGSETGLLNRAVRFGPDFKRPSRSVMRRHKALRGVNLFSKQEIHSLLANAKPVMKAMILLALNAGLGNCDVGRLENRHLDLEAGWLDFPRPKTGIARRAKLWDETVEAVKEAFRKRPVPADRSVANRIFLTSFSNAWATGKIQGDPVAGAFASLMAKAGIEKRGRRGFYTMRHVFRTVADSCLDRVAIGLVMGHSDPSIAAYYTETIDDMRLEAVAEHVRRWLFTGDAPDGQSGPERTLPMSSPVPDEAPEAAERGPSRLRLYAG